MWSSNWYPDSENGTNLTFTVTNETSWGSCPTITFTFDETKAVDESITRFRKFNDTSFGNINFSPYGTGYECAPMDVGIATYSGHQTVGAIALLSMDVEFDSPDDYAAYTTQWLVSDAGVTYTDNRGITLDGGVGRDISGLVITPAMNCYYCPINEENVQKLLVNSPNAIWVELYQGDPDTNQSVFRQKYAMANYQTSDLVITMDEAVEDVQYIRTWVDDVYDPTYRDGSTSGSGTAATSNMGVFAQIRVIEETDADLTTLTGSDCEESTRYSAAADMSSMVWIPSHYWKMEPLHSS